ncbi:hypothetical protein ON010_g10841 [Phytophthora cinnamomi]|nr:hypothetical protein ON010_g10841 [Phytophthora cinnamomi]
MQACSIQFVNRNSNFRRGAKRSQLAYAILECPDLPAFWHHRFRLRSETHTSFSFDVWFCCFPSTATQPSGGVIYGVQNSRVSIRHQGCISEQFVVVDAQNKLYCSVLNEKQAVCQLSQNRWYHVALTYDVNRQCQDVYVDGRRVWSAIGSLNRKWQRCNYEQIGTGFCENIPTAEDPFIPFLELGSGWYSFHGIVDEFRVWRSALPPVAIGKLGRAEHLDGFEIRATVKPSHGRRNLWIRTKSVRCTRPAEGKTMSIYGSVLV